MASPLLIRADASPVTGTGHLMRCLALAQAWQDLGGAARFLVGAGVPAAVARLREEGFPAEELTLAPGGKEDVERTLAAASAAGAGWVVLDGYSFGTGFQDAVKKAGFKLLALDDFAHASHVIADFVLNQNLGAGEELYATRDPSTRLLLGPRYALLRREFAAWSNRRGDVRESARNILVTLGGVDAGNVMLRVAGALGPLPAETRVAIVAGGDHAHRRELAALCRREGPRFHLRRPARGMPALMAWADLAVSGGGSTCWELAFLGVPALSVTLAENQRRVAAALAEAGATRALGWHEALDARSLRAAVFELARDPAARRQMSRRGRELVDGRGAMRVAALLRGDAFTLRRATPDDCRLLWEWANDPAVRASSFSPAPIPWEDHRRWFAARLAAPETLILVAELDRGIPLGQIRFDGAGGAAEIDVSVASRFRGAGFGSRLIGRGTEELFRRSAVREAYAVVRRENASARLAFAQAGFTETGREERGGTAAIRFRMRAHRD